MKNLKQVVTNVLLAVFGVLMLGFGGGHYLALRGEGIGGYDLFELLQDGLDVANSAQPEVYVYIIGIVLAIVSVSLLIVFAGLSLLCDYKVIKSEKANKWVNILKLVSAILVVVAFVLVLASVLKMVANRNLEVGYGLIVDVVLAVLSVAVLVFAMVLGKKKA